MKMAHTVTFSIYLILNFTSDASHLDEDYSNLDLIKAIKLEYIHITQYSVGLIVVPVYDSLGKDAAKYIVNHSDCKIIVSSLYKFPLACQLTHECPDISHFVLMNDKIPQEIQCPITVTTCSDVLKKGIYSRAQNHFSGPDDVAVIMYTSGSTGTPK